MMEHCRKCKKPTPRGSKRAKGMCRACYMKVYKARYLSDPKKYEHERRRAAQYYQDHIEHERRRNAATNRALRLEAIAAYGGKCRCCGETEEKFLTLDHINGGGKQHRLRARGSTGTIYRDLKKQGWPKKDYQM